MEALLGIGLLMALMVFGVPVAWSFAGVLMFLVWAYDVNTATLLLQGFRSLDSVILLALPLFVLAGYLMQSGGVARRLISFMSLTLKGRKGGLGGALILSSGVFGAISGTATAAVASIGTIMVDLSARLYQCTAGGLIALGYSHSPFDHAHSLWRGHTPINHRALCGHNCAGPSIDGRASDLQQDRHAPYSARHPAASGCLAGARNR